MENKTRLELAAQRFNLSVEEMAIILNLENWTKSDVTATTIANVYNKIPIDSEAQAVALKKWGELCDSFLEIDYFFKIVRPEGKTKEFVLTKKNELALTAVENANTLDEIISAHNQSPKDSEAKTAALTKWNKLALIAVENANTLDEIISAYKLSPHEMEPFCDTDTRNIATKKGIGFCTTVQEIRKLFSSNPHKSSCPENIQIKWILEKWSELLYLEIDKITTIKEIKSIIENIPKNCPFNEILYPVKGYAHKKWGELCITYEDLKEYLGTCSPYGEEEYCVLQKIIPLCTTVDQASDFYLFRNKTQDLALQKWDELSLLEIEKATTKEQVLLAYHRAHSGSRSQSAAMEKYISLL